MLRPPTVDDSRVSAQTLQLDDRIRALVSEAEQHPVHIAWAAGVPGLAALALTMREQVARFGRAFGFGLGWEPAQLDLLASLDVSGLVAPSQPTKESGRRFRRGLYLAGARQPDRRSTADERARAEAKRWGLVRSEVA